MWIYCITGPTGRRYVGKTHKPVQARWKRHLADSRRGVGCKVLQRAILLHGPEAFTVATIGQFDDKDTLVLAERLFIAELNTKAPGGYNLTDGGDGGGRPPN